MKLKTKYKKRTEKFTNMWRFNKILNNLWVKEEIKRGIEKYIETSKIENRTYHNSWSAEKAFIRENFIVINAYINKKERTQKQLNVLSQGSIK